MVNRFSDIGIKRALTYNSFGDSQGNGFPYILLGYWLGGIDGQYPNVSPPGVVSPYPGGGGSALSEYAWDKLLTELQRYLGITNYASAGENRNSLPYRPDGSTSIVYRDCSSYVHFALYYAEFNIIFPMDQGNAYATPGLYNWVGGSASEIDFSQAKPGDMMILWPTSYSAPIGGYKEHAAIYVGNDKWIDCSSTGVAYRDVYGTGTRAHYYRIPESLWPIEPTV